MPTFSFLKSPRRDSQRIDGSVVMNLESESPPAKNQKIQRRQSRRAYFRSLLPRKPSLFSESRKRRRSDQLTASHSSKAPSPASIPTEQPTSPMSLADKNKPLPQPPAPDTETEPPTKPGVKLARIISPIALPDLHNLFSGAPQFFDRSEGHHSGAPHPSAAFPWNIEVDIRDLCDHAQIHEEAWGSVTAWPHITVQTRRNPEALEDHHEKRRAHFLPRCRERPCMLSMQGTERGTVGFQAALELGVADALDAKEESAKQESISENRKKFLHGKDGLRPITDARLIDRLLVVSETYHKDPMKHKRSSVELYSELFTQVLYPPSKVIDTDDPYSLQVQIEALIEVLAAPLVWVDFSLVEWRIRLGQILWGAPSNPEPEDEVVVNGEVIHEPGTQKYWLLLQLLLSSELLIRLDTISMSIDQGLEAVNPVEIKRFDKIATTSVKWSLILARTWLENIRLHKLDPEETPEQKPAGWLASLTGTTSAPVDVKGVKDELGQLQFHGRHQTRQLSGLLHFARKLNWPNLDELSTKVLANNIVIIDSVESTPVGTPSSLANQQSTSYFSKRRPPFRRGLSSQRSLSAIIRPAGWLSNSYLSGLILPGEGMGHFLISTLLENDFAAITKLGEEANLYGGFIYCGRSFWSTSCIVGRVLAVRKGASECMGWISSDVIPRGAGECWVDIDVELAENPERKPDKKTRKARIWQKTAVENDGHVVGGADTSSVLPGDFIVPSDEPIQAPPTVSFESLDLFAAMDSDEPSPTEEKAPPLTESSSSITSKIQTYSAMIRFWVELNGEEKKEMNIALNHDVLFVTAHPCVPSPHMDILKSPTSPSLRGSNGNRSGSTKALSGHPLHKAFTYTKTPISRLLSYPLSTPFSALLSPPSSPDPTQSSTHTTSSKIPKVLIIDCTDPSITKTSPVASLDSQEGRKRAFGSDLEMLARALCAERGWNALVSRRGRGCLACAVREAGALGWEVVIRVA